MAHGLRPAPHHLRWLERLRATVETPGGRLLLVAPPGHGEVSYVSFVLPLWYLGNHPERAILAVTSSDAMASQFHGTVALALEQNPAHTAVFPTPECRPTPARGWSTDGLDLGGSPRDQGPQLPVAGFGAGDRLRCFVGDTLIQTETGPRPIRDVVRSSSGGRVLAFDHVRGHAVWRRVVASRTLETDALVEVVTRAGRRFRCTPDHPIYVHRSGYRRRRYSVPVTASAPRGTCPLCGGPMSDTGRMCWPCYQRARSQGAWVEFPCPRCGTSVRRRRCEVDKQRQRQGTMTRRCSAPPAARRLARGTRPSGPAARCGCPVPTRPVRRYCSPACKQAVREERWAARTIGRQWCGLVFAPANTRRRFCDPVCASARARGAHAGGGQLALQDGDQCYAKWFTEMRPLVLERDGHRCVVCQRPEALRAHALAGLTSSTARIWWRTTSTTSRRTTPRRTWWCCARRVNLATTSRKTTRWPWFGAYALGASRSMTSRWKAATTSLRTAYSPTTVTSSSWTTPSTSPWPPPRWRWPGCASTWT